MSQKASQPKKKASANRPRFALQLTRKQLFLWSGLAFLAMVWMFALGVLVGRGLSPVRFDVPKLKKELMALKEEALKTDQARFNVETENLSGNPELDFYKTLTDKKEEARLNFVKAHERPAQPYLKYSEVFKPKKTGSQRVFTIQVASLKSAEEAGHEVARLKRKGYDAYEITVNVPGKGAYHRVRVGHFAEPREADLVAARLREDKLKTMIVRE